MTNLSTAGRLPADPSEEPTVETREVLGFSLRRVLGVFCESWQGADAAGVTLSVRERQHALLASERWVARLTRPSAAADWIDEDVIRPVFASTRDEAETKVRESLAALVRTVAS